MQSLVIRPIAFDFENSAKSKLAAILRGSVEILAIPSQTRLWIASIECLIGLAAIVKHLKFLGNRDWGNGEKQADQQISDNF